MHKDSSTLFAGLIYLNRVPEKDTGTDLYIEKDGYAWTENDDTIIEHKHYSGEQVLDEDYEKAYNRVQSQYDQTDSPVHQRQKNLCVRESQQIDRVV